MYFSLIIYLRDIYYLTCNFRTCSSSCAVCNACSCLFDISKYCSLCMICFIPKRSMTSCNIKINAIKIFEATCLRTFICNCNFALQLHGFCLIWIFSFDILHLVFSSISKSSSPSFDLIRFAWNMEKVRTLCQILIFYFHFLLSLLLS